MTSKTEDEAAFLAQLGLRVRRARARAGLTRRRLAALSRVSERYLAQLESGDGNGSILLIRRLAAALAVDLDELIGQRVDLERSGRIALVGVRGAGKSTLGARLADRLGMPFIELADEIERALGVPLDSVIAQDGQHAYREAERRALADVVETHARCVIAAGGSLVLEPLAYQLLRSRCFTVWLRASPEDHISRLIAQRDLRPLQGREHVLAELRMLLVQRERLYAMADLAIDTSANGEAACLQILLEAVSDAGIAGPLPEGDSQA